MLRYSLQDNQLKLFLISLVMNYYNEHVVIFLQLIFVTIGIISVEANIFNKIKSIGGTVGRSIVMYVTLIYHNVFIFHKFIYFCILVIMFSIVLQILP